MPTGSTIFEIGRGLGGFCSSPLVVSISTGSAGILLFLITMLIEMVLAKLLILRLQKVIFKLKLHGYIFLINSKNIEIMKLLNKISY